jgi:hypothetical protein
MVAQPPNKVLKLTKGGTVIRKNGSFINAPFAA